MKRVIPIFTILILILAITLSSGIKPVSAQLFNVSWASGYQVLNPSLTEDATIFISYYNEDGTLATLNNTANPVQDTVARSSSNNYYPIHSLEGFRGSIVISSTLPVFVITNVVINTPAQGTGSYVGINQGATVLNFPLVVKGNANQTSVLTIQNTSDTSADITIKFTPLVGSTFPAIGDVTDTIPAFASHSFDLSTLAAFSGVNRWIGAASVSVADTTNNRIAGVSNTVNVGVSTAYQLATYNAFSSSGSTTVVLPLIQENNNGNRTGVSCQNVGSSPTTITITYKKAGANYVDKAPQSVSNVPAGGMAVFIQDYTGTAKFVGSAVVSSNPASNMVCIVNQQKLSNGSYSSYEGFNPSVASEEVVLPLIVSRNGKPTTGYTYTAFSIATADGLPHPVTCDFIPSPGFADVPNQTMTGATSVFSQHDIYGTGARFIGSAKCKVDDYGTTGVGIFAVVNQTRQNSPVPFRDILSTYTGFNISP